MDDNKDYETETKSSKIKNIFKNKKKRSNHLIFSILPNLFRRPVRVVGIPVAFAIFRFADVK